MCIDPGSNTLFEETEAGQSRTKYFIRDGILTENAVHQVHNEDEDLRTGHALVEVHGPSHLRHHFREDHSTLKEHCQDIQSHEYDYSKTYHRTRTPC